MTGQTQIFPDMKKTVRRFLDGAGVRRGDGILAGVSGGADSVCLLYLLASLREEPGLRLSVVHVEHGIRGEESEADARFVRELCEGLQVPCRICRADVPRIAAERGLSLEEAGRAVRYSLFEEIRREEGAAWVAVAHNRGDLAETVLWNLARGSGLKGLTGIRPVSTLPAGSRQIHTPPGEEAVGTEEVPTGGEAVGTEEVLTGEEAVGTEEVPTGGAAPGAETAAVEQENGRAGSGEQRLLRPLLEFSRAQIEAGLTEIGAVWRTDSTNADTAYTRNRIRHSVLPAMAQVNERAAEHIAAAAGQAAAAEDYLERVTQQALAACLVPGPDAKTDGQMAGPAAETDDQVPGPAAQADGCLILDTAPLRALDPYIRSRVLREGVRRVMPGESLRDIGAVHIRMLEDLTAGSEGRSADLPGGLHARRSGGCLQLLRCAWPETDAEAAQICVPITGSGIVEAGGRRFVCEVLEGEGVPCHFPEKRYTKWLAYDTILECDGGGEPLCIRTRRPGDYLLTGGGHRQKLKEYLINEKVPREKRGALLLVARGSHVLWVVGGRLSEGAKVRPGDTACLRISLRQGTTQEGRA